MMQRGRDSCLARWPRRRFVRPRVRCAVAPNRSARRRLHPTARHGCYALLLRNVPPLMGPSSARGGALPACCATEPCGRDRTSATPLSAEQRAEHSLFSCDAQRRDPRQDRLLAHHPEGTPPVRATRRHLLRNENQSVKALWARSALVPGLVGDATLFRCTARLACWLVRPRMHSVRNAERTNRQVRARLCCQIAR